MSSLALTERDFVLELSHMGFVSGLMDAVGAPEGVRPQLLRCIIAIREPDTVLISTVRAPIYKVIHKP